MCVLVCALALEAPKRTSDEAAAGGGPANRIAWTQDGIPDKTSMPVSTLTPPSQAGGQPTSRNMDYVCSRERDLLRTVLAGRK